MSDERIVLFGLFGGTNLGNEATLASCLAAIRRLRPAAELACVGHAPAGAPGIAALPLDPMPIARWPAVHRLGVGAFGDSVTRVLTLASEPVRRTRARRALTAARLFLVPGTGVVDDFGQRSIDLPLHLERWCRAARESGVPAALLSVGASRIESTGARARFRAALSLASYVTVRDAASRANVAGLGGPPVRVVPDLAFALPPERLGTPEAVSWPPRCVALGVMGYRGWNVDAAKGERIYADYLARIERVARALLAAGCSLRLIHGDTRADPGAVTELAERLRAAVPGDRVLAPRIRTFDDVLDQLRLSDLALATRYHNVLFALLLGRCALSLGYSDKNDALMGDFGLQQYCWDVERFEPDDVIARMRELCARAAPPTHSVGATLREFRARVQAQYETVLARPGSRDEGDRR